MTRRVIFLNGPPRSGKDTVAKGLLHQLGPQNATIVKFADPLTNIAKVILGMTEKEFLHYREEAKDEPLPEPFDHLTMRQLLIKISEEWIKPTFGERYFGHAMVRRLNHLMSPTVIISDSGFYDEAVPVLSRYGADRCLLIQVSRFGATFEGDSRSYWQMYNTEPVRINNRYDVSKESDMFEAQMRRIIDGWDCPV